MTLHKLLTCHSSWGALLLYAMSSNHFLMACKTEVYSPQLEGFWVPIFPWLVIAILIALAKIPKHKESISIQLLWATAWLLVTHVSLIYLVDEFFFLFLLLLNEMRMLVNLRFLVLIKGMREGGEPKIFLCYPRSSGTSYQSFCKWGGVLSACLYLIKLIIVGFCWRLMLLVVMSVGFENICTVSEKWNVSKFVPRIYGWVYKIIWLTSITTEDSEVVVTTGYQSGGPWFDSCKWPILVFHFIIFVFSSSGGIKFVILVEGSYSACCFS